MELCSIASGSSGNCICVGTDECHVLVDAGISGKRIESGLNSIDLKTEEMQGILITHEHVDHIAGLGVLARRYGLPMYATPGTIDAILHTKSVGMIDPALFHEIHAGEDFTIGDMTIEPIAISHDAAEPVAYKMKQPGKSMAVMTDLGIYDDHIVEKLKGLDVLLLEANHDVGRKLSVSVKTAYSRRKGTPVQRAFRAAARGGAARSFRHGLFRTSVQGK